MVHAVASLTTIPVSPVAPAIGDTWYLPVIHSLRFGRYMADVALRDAADKTGIVSDLIEGQLEEVGAVLAINLANGSSEDASKEIAHAVVDALPQGEPIPQHLVDFLEEYLGVSLVAAIDHELQYGSAA